MEHETHDNVVHLHGKPMTVDEALEVAHLEAKEVVVIGVRDDGYLTLSSSGRATVYEVIGLLERAKASYLASINEHR